MTLKELNSSITNKESRDFYIFVGTEVFVMDTYIDKICDTFGYKKMLGSYHPTFEKDVLFVDRNNMSILKNNKAWGYINKTILCFDSLDKRSAFYKKFENDIVFFNKLPQEILTQYIQQKSNLSTEFAHKLIDCCDYDYSTILSELDKICTYAKIKKLDENIAIIEFLNNEQLTTKASSESLKFASFLVSADVLNVYNTLKDLNIDETILTLSTCYSLFKSLYLIESYNGPSNKICEATGLNYYQVKNLTNSRGVYSVDELENALKLIQNTIANIKKGLISNDIALKYVVSLIL